MSADHSAVVMTSCEVAFGASPSPFSFLEIDCSTATHLQLYSAHNNRISTQYHPRHVTPDQYTSLRKHGPSSVRRMDLCFAAHAMPLSTAAAYSVLSSCLLCCMICVSFFRCLFFSFTHRGTSVSMARVQFGRATNSGGRRLNRSSQFAAENQKKPFFSSTCLQWRIGNS